MLRHIARRLLLAIPTLIAVVTIIFLVVRVIPGDTARAVLGDYASEETVQAYRNELGLDEPLWRQYVTYMGGLARGDLGDSLITRKPAWDQIRYVLPQRWSSLLRPC
jgi:ABC-type dipeptide/oligopeptide/nickel transport system permease component